MASALLTSSVLILAILLLRKLFRGKVGDGFLYGLWLVVAVRLLMPVPEFFLENVAGIESPWVGSSASVMNVAEGLASRWEDDAVENGEEGSGTKLDQSSQEKPETALPDAEEEMDWQKVEDSVREEEGSVMSQEEAEEGEEPGTPENTGDSDMYEKNRGGGWQFRKFFHIPLARMAAVVWLSGSLLMLLAQVLSESRFRRRLAACREEVTLCGQKAYKARGISTPLLFRSGGLALDIYIPEEIADDEGLVRHALLHENAHRRHGDVWWGYLRNLLLAAYWFDPLVWVAAVCSKRDCEFACDNSVIRGMSREERISYGNSLLSLVEAGGPGNPLHTATLMGAGKSELKRRIYLVKGGRRRGVGATVLLAVIVAAVGFCTFTDARAEESRETVAQGQEKLSAISTESKEALVPGVTTLPQDTSGLTMEKLLDAYDRNKLSEWTARRMSKYGNMTRIPQEGATLGKAYTGVLPYEGVDYRVWLRYYKKSNKLADIVIKNMETGELDEIFNKKNDYKINTPEEFFHHENVLDEQISYTLPEKLLATKDSYNVAGTGRLFCRDEKEMHGLFGMLGSVLWNTTGGLMIGGLRYREKTVDLNFYHVYGVSDEHLDRQKALEGKAREFQGGKLQSIEGCENMTSLQGLVFNKDAIDIADLVWYSQDEAAEEVEDDVFFYNRYKVSASLGKKMRKTLADRKLWIICVAGGNALKEYVEDIDNAGYIFFFDGERYTKEQMVELARSIHLK